MQHRLQLFSIIEVVLKLNKSLEVNSVNFSALNLNMNRISSAKKAFHTVTHVIFDLDGLLLDTETIYTEATNNVVEKFGKTYDWEMKIQIMGLTGEEAAKQIVKLLDLPLTWDEYYKLAHEQYKILMPNAKFMPDTETVYKRVISNIAKEHGKVYTNDVRLKLLGSPDTDASRICVSEMKLPMTNSQFLIEFRQRSKQLLVSCPFMPGAEDLIKHLHKNRVPIAVATSSTQESADLKIAKHKEVFSLFNHIITGGSDPEVKHGKPSPDIFLICATRFVNAPSPEKCLVFEDAPNGVTAANKAGMQCVMVPDEHIGPEQTSHASIVLKSLKDVQLELFGLPAIK